MRASRSPSVRVTPLRVPSVRRVCAPEPANRLPAMAFAAFGDDVIGEYLHVGPASFEDRHLHTAFVIQIDALWQLDERANAYIRDFGLRANFRPPCIADPWSSAKRYH